MPGHMKCSEVALYPVAPSIPKAHERSKRVVSYSHPIDIHQKRNPNTDNASKMQNAGKKQDALESEEEMEIVGVEVVCSRPGPVLNVEALIDEKPLRLSNAPARRLQSQP